MAGIIKAQLQQPASPGAAMLNLNDFAEEARAVVLDARRQAAKILADARARVEATRKTARETGYSEGLEQGRQEGFNAGLDKARSEDLHKLDRELRELKTLAGKMVNELVGAKTELMHQAHSEMLEMVIELAEKIVGPLARADVSVAKMNLAKALELAGAAGELMVKVNPGQLEQLRQHCGELAEALSIPGTIRLVGDEKVGLGGVKLYSGGGMIDATVETQLANVAEALAGGRARRVNLEP